MANDVPSISRLLQDVFNDFLIHVAGLTVQEVKVYGPKDENANIAPPGVWWAIGREKWGSWPGTRLGTAGIPGTLYVREIPISILVFGGDRPLEDNSASLTEEASTDLQSTDITEMLIGKLINSFQRRLTQNGYRPEGAEWGQAAQTGIGLACELTVAIRLPLLREDNESVAMLPVTTSTEFRK